MPTKVQILAILINIILLAIILYMLYKRHIREGYSLIWLLGVFTLLGLSIFRGMLTRAADFLGIGYAPTLLFAVSLVFMITIMLSFAASITNLVRKNRDLAQEMALLKWYIQQLRLESLAKKYEEPQSTIETIESEDPEQAVLSIKEQEVNR